jgi:hypothetical protein
MSEQQQQSIKERGRLTRQKMDASESMAQGVPITIQEACWLTIVYNRLDKNRIIHVGKEIPGHKTPSTQALKAAAEALEWHRKKLEDAGDIVAANVAKMHAATLKEQVKDLEVAERRKSIRLVLKDDSGAESV